MPTLVAVIVVGMILKAALSIAAMNYVGFAVADLATRLRTELVARLLRARWSYFVGHPVGRISHIAGRVVPRSVQAYLLSAQATTLMLNATRKSVGEDKSVSLLVVTGIGRN